MRRGRPFARDQPLTGRDPQRGHGGPGGRPDRHRRDRGARHARRRAARRRAHGRPLRAGARLGRRVPPARRAHQRRHARGCAEGARVRRGGDRAVPHRAHVHGLGPPAQDARDDHGRHRGGAPGRAGRAAPAPAGGLRGPVRGDGRPADHDPPARPAAARVPAQGGRARPRHRPRPARPGRRPGRARADARAHAPDPGDQPDARHPRLPARDRLPRDLRDAGARPDARRAHRPRRLRRPAAPGDHDPARRLRAGDRDHARARRRESPARRACARASTTPSAR